MIKKIHFILLIIFSLVILDLINEIQVEAKSSSEIRDFLKEEYNGFYNIGNDFKTYSVKSGKYYNLNESSLNNALLYYGTPQMVTEATYVDSNTYYPSWKNYRYLGVTVDGIIPFAHNNMPEDYDTSGDTATRRYVDYPYKSSTVVNNSFKPKANTWNHAHKVQVKFLESGKFYSVSEAEGIINLWLEFIDDHYARNHDYYRSHSSAWIERSTDNEWLKMTAEKRRRVAYITQPPTEETYGSMIEWHQFWNGSKYTNSKHLYDVFDILPLSWSKDNFTATKIEGVQIGDTLNLYFTVKNNSLNEVDTNFALPTSVTVHVDGIEFGTYQVEEHGIEWEKGESKTAFIGSIEMFDIDSKTPISVTAKFNPNEKEDFEERIYSDNSLTKVFYKKTTADKCNINGSGEEGVYSVRVCNGWSCDEDGCWCSSTTCENRYVNLQHNVDLTFSESRQELHGMWSSNSKGHNLYQTKVPTATKSDVVNEKWKQKINHSIPTVDKLKRVIRAGRGLEMYGTMEIEMTIQSFIGESDLNSKRDKFVNDIIKELENNGVKVDNSTVSNHKGNKSVQAQIDGDRIKIGDYYIEYKEEKMTKQILGDNTCTRITIFTKKYKFTIPVKSKNEGGEQTTYHGDIKDKKTYSVGEGITTFFTNVNTMNGIHGINFSTTLKGKSFDSSFNKEKYCKSKIEKFAIQGNIYDDVRADDVTDKIGEQNWDF